MYIPINYTHDSLLILFSVWFFYSQVNETKTCYALLKFVYKRYPKEHVAKSLEFYNFLKCATCKFHQTFVFKSGHNFLHYVHIIVTRLKTLLQQYNDSQILEPRAAATSQSVSDSISCLFFKIIFYLPVDE